MYCCVFELIIQLFFIFCFLKNIEIIKVASSSNALQNQLIFKKMRILQKLTLNPISSEKTKYFSWRESVTGNRFLPRKTANIESSCAGMGNLRMDIKKLCFLNSLISIPSHVL